MPSPGGEGQGEGESDVHEVSDSFGCGCAALNLCPSSTHQLPHSLSHFFSVHLPAIFDI